jgi:hypothetical protein
MTMMMTAATRPCAGAGASATLRTAGGNWRLPLVTLYEALTGRRNLKDEVGTVPLSAATGPLAFESPGSLGSVTGREGDSLGNVYRGDGI